MSDNLKKLISVCLGYAKHHQNISIVVKDAKPDDYRYNVQTDVSKHWQQLLYYVHKLSINT